ncbi:MAG: GAF domain-containing SpoIIE family protein phosphatase [Rhodothermales bacterium]
MNTELLETIRPPEIQSSRGELIRKQLYALDFISNLLTETSFALQPLLNKIVGVTAEVMNMKACTIRLLDARSGEMKLVATYGLSSTYLTKGPVIAAKSFFRQLIEDCCKENDVVEIHDVANDPTMQYTREAIAEGIHSLLAAPLARDGRAIGALTVFSAEPHYFSEDERRLFKTIANQASVAISLAQLYQEKIDLKRIEHELEIAAAIQRKLLPSSSPHIPNFEIAGRSKPCQEIGGDFYDFISLPEGNFGFALGDVAGKGIPASLLMATVRTALRVQAENVYAMREVVGKVNRAVYEDTRPEEFITLFYGVLNAESRGLTYVNAGHNTAAVIRGDKIISMEPSGPPLAILPDLLAGEETLDLQKGDVLVVFSDGYPDAPGTQGESFGEERVLDVLRNNRELSTEEMIDQLEAAVEQFMAGSPEYCDDRTVVVIKCTA